MIIEKVSNVVKHEPGKYSATVYFVGNPNPHYLTSYKEPKVGDKL